MTDILELAAMRASLEDAIGASGYAQTSNWAVKHGRALLDHIAAQDARIEALEGALQGMQGDVETGTWLEAVKPIVVRFDIAAKFEADAVHNGTGAAAIAELMRQMAARLDMAVAVSKAALGGEQHGG